MGGGGLRGNVGQAQVSLGLHGCHFCVVLKPGLVKLQGLRNRMATEMGYHSFFDLEVADYDMSQAQMMNMLDSQSGELRIAS